MPKPLIVIDTNVLVAGLRSNRGWSFELLTRIGGASFDHCISTPLLLEYEDVLKRMATALGLDFPAIDTLQNYWCAAGRKTLIYFQIGPTAADPGDAKVLELAVSARADFIVTFNQRHFPEAERFGIKVVTPVEFLAKIGTAP
jgi:putative PIN family toxin of toxin-antitoxin system